MDTITSVGFEKTAEILEHAGVKGMRWGVRRSQESLDRAAGRTQAKADKAADKADKSRGTKTKEESKTDTKGNVKKMSDADLKSAVSRLQMEKQYSDLTNPQKSNRKTESFIKKNAKTVIVGSAVTVAAKIVTSHLEGRTSGLKYKPVVPGTPLKKGVGFLPPVPGTAFRP